MSTEKDKIYASAQKFLQRGQLDRAIREFERLLDDEPNDARTLLKIGDLQTRLSDSAAAVATYIRVATLYTQQGFSLKAVAVHKQVLKLDATQTQTAQALANLYQQLGLVSDASETLRGLIDALEGKKDFKGAVAAVTTLLELEPEELSTQLRYAELYAQHGDIHEARRMFGQIVQRLAKVEKGAQWAQVGERLLQLDHELSGLACELAKFYMAQNLPHKALVKLQIAFHEAPQDHETLSLLAQVFEALDQIPKAIVVLHELLAQAKERNQPIAEMRIAQHILKLKPEDLAAQAVVDGVKPAKKKGEMSFSQPAIKAVKLGPPEPSAKPEAVAPALARQEIANLLIEAVVFLKYGLHQRALDHVDRVLVAFPDHAEALASRDQVLAHRAHKQHGGAAQHAPPTKKDATPDALFAEAIGNTAPTSKSAGSADALATSHPAREPGLVEPNAAVAHAEPAPPNAQKPDQDLEVFDLDLSSGSALPSQQAAADSLPSDVGDGGKTSFDPQQVNQLIDDALPPSGPNQAKDPEAQISLDEVFKDFKKGVDSSVDHSDYDTHFNLGIAYKEMGLVDDAIAQFQKTLLGSQFVVNALSMIGVCHLEAGRPQEACTTLMEGLKEPIMTPQQKVALLYELGRAQEALSHNDEARQSFQAASAIDASFRDLAHKLSGRQPTDAGADAPKTIGDADNASVEKT